ncbi:MAG: hypothetical protein QOH63_2428 [Acidobacteriota bacterium]|jgi:hypothetical protein|nr:hypothetical protein [Acidobacteriota bacterium]
MALRKSMLEERPRETVSKGKGHLGNNQQAKPVGNSRCSDNA